MLHFKKRYAQNRGIRFYNQKNIKFIPYSPLGEFTFGQARLFSFQSLQVSLSAKTTKTLTKPSFTSTLITKDFIGIVYTSESGTTTTYYFQRNLLGDGVGIYDTSGTKVGGYAYDAWGNCTITLDENGIAFRNPIRYRGYYYDEDTKLYYLNVRYYCPEWRRFISPDDTAYLDSESANGLNLYAYCNNDPVNYADPSGHLGIALTLLISTGIGLVLGLGMEVAKQASEEGKFWDLSTWNWDPSSWNWWEIGKSALVGAATGLAYGFGGVAGGIMKGSFQTLTIAGKALTVSHSVGLLLGGAAIANFAAGVAGYTMHTAGSKNESFNILKGLSEGIGQTGKGVLSFFAGGMYASLGFWKVGKDANNTLYSIFGRAVGRYIANFIPNYMFENLF